MSARPVWTHHWFNAKLHGLSVILYFIRWHFQEIRKYSFVKIGHRTSFIPFIWKFQTEGFPEAHVLSPQLKCKIKSITLIICLYLSKLLCLFKSGYLQGGAGKRGPSFLFSFPLFLPLPDPK